MPPIIIISIGCLEELRPSLLLFSDTSEGVVNHYYYNRTPRRAPSIIIIITILSPQLNHLHLIQSASRQKGKRNEEQYFGFLPEQEYYYYYRTL